MRELSKAIFGQELRLALCLFVGRHSSGEFTQTEAAKALEVSGSALQAPLRDLVTAGLLVKAPTIPGHRNRYLVRQDGSFAWKFAEELLGLGPDNQLTLPLE